MAKDQPRKPPPLREDRFGWRPGEVELTFDPVKLSKVKEKIRQENEEGPRSE